MVSRDRFLQNDRHFHSLLISSPQGHSGKTIVTVGLCRLLTERGLSIQPFKKGPDYIDPSWLTVAAGRSCRNLDLFLIPEDRLLQSFHRSCEGADLAVVEGAMGLYDGLDSYGTTAEIASLLNLPILLVVNTSRMTTSIAAMVKGYQLFQTDIKIAGVILNYVSGRRHEEKLRGAVEQHCGIPVVGSIPRDPDLQIAERHLGLIPSLESDGAMSLVERVGNKLGPHLDLEGILKIAKESRPPLPVPFPTGERKEERGDQPIKAKIGVMRDRAFNFYYPENLEALEKEGAQLIFINSFVDRLPEVDGLYFGGGFPEFFLEDLEKNRELREDIARVIEVGLPVYAECAGLMYLCRSIHWQGRSYEMVGIIPAEVQLSKKPEGHGYAVVEVIDENPFFPIGLTLRGHEFHHSSLSRPGDLRFAYQVKRGQGVHHQRDGIVYKNLFASYVHLHALGTPEWARGFVSLVSKEKRSNLRVHPRRDCAGPN
ncbi:MAG TPA: cobyrinate a,c-diamide synthase [Thermodesulfobacteriota bacterium]|nr:cobyrinate a,c-diamide synthase [Thermodesulfobacteriota bacterium]